MCTACVVTRASLRVLRVLSEAAEGKKRGKGGREEGRKGGREEGRKGRLTGLSLSAGLPGSLSAFTASGRLTERPSPHCDHC